MITRIYQSLRKSIALDVLEAAKDAGDQAVIDACRRILNADRLGLKRHGNPADIKMVCAFYSAN